MSSMNVSMPEQMKEWVENQISLGRYHNASEYIRELIRKDQDRLSRDEAFRAAINAGRESGLSDKTAEEVFESAREKASSAE